MRTGIDPTVDYAFKRVFATEENAPLLIHFLNAVLDPEPSKRVAAIDLLTTINDKSVLLFYLFEHWQYNWPVC